MALGACAGSNVNTNYQTRGIFEISPKRAEELRAIPDQQLSQEDRCRLARQNLGVYTGKNPHALTNTIIGRDLQIGDETVVPCYIHKTMPQEQRQEILFGVKKPGAEITYSFDREKNKVDKVIVKYFIGPDNSFSEVSFYHDKEAMNLAGEKVDGYFRALEDLKEKESKIRGQERKKALEFLK